MLHEHKLQILPCNTHNTLTSSTQRRVCGAAFGLKRTSTRIVPGQKKTWVLTTRLLWREALGNSNCGSSFWPSQLEPICLLITCWTTSLRPFHHTTVTSAPWTTEVFSGIYPRMRSCALASQSGRTGSRTPVWCLPSLSMTCCCKTPPMPLIFQQCLVSKDGFMTTAHSGILWWQRWIWPAWLYINVIVRPFKNNISYHSQWDLVCDKRKLKRTSTTVFFIGVMFGAALFGFLSDK